MTSQEDDRRDARERRGRALIELLERYLPWEYEAADLPGAWPALGVALLARMAATLDAILVLQRPERHDVDANVLLRTLYEHLVCFAWLAADPSTARLEEWRKQDLDERLKTHNDFLARGVKLLEDDSLRAFGEELSGLRGNASNVADMAIAADRHWLGKLPGVVQQGSMKSFRGWYAVIYRQGSGFAHPTIRGLGRFVEELGGRRRAVRHELIQRDGPYGMAVMLFGVALLVAAQTLGWPSKEDVRVTFNRIPMPEGETP